MKKGILLTNLGSPDAPTPAALKVYLDQFLMDPYVIDVPYLLRALLIRGIVLRKRPAESAKAYATIWNSVDNESEKNTGSPLVAYTRRTTEKMQKILGAGYSVKFGMRYGNPALPTVLDEFVKEGIDEVTLMPLYPQWALASTGSTLAYVQELNHPCKISKSLKAFYEDERFTELIYRRVLQATAGGTDKSLKTHYVFSYHGLPERHIRKSPGCGTCALDDTCCTRPVTPAYCYRAHATKTTLAVARKLQLRPEDYTITFQSRLGPDKWLQPPTDVVIKALPGQGVERLVMLSPAFTADCLETLEELGERGQHDFLQAGGKDFILVPSLNDGDDWAALLASWAQDPTYFGSVDFRS